MIIEIRGEDADPELKGRRFRVQVEELCKNYEALKPQWVLFPDGLRPYHETRILQEAIDQLIGDDA